MYSLDKPIVKEEEDLLGRNYFAKNLANAIYSIGENENITVGMYGKWGSGKTSILNLVENELKSIASQTQDDNSSIVLRFEPWNFTDNANLITQFFQFLQVELKMKNSTQIAKDLEKYTNMMAFTEVIPYVGLVNKILARLAKGMQEDSVLSAKRKLIENLKKEHKKIIIVIDNIDRLSNEKIRMIFQLVNSIGDLPNLIYLLAMDKDVVVRALENIQDFDGNMYLEKIVQIPFEIPPIQKEVLYDILDAKIFEIMSSKPQQDIHFNIDRYEEVLDNCLESHIETVRDINRIMNVFRFNYNLMYLEVDIADMLAVIALQVMKPKVYEWIVGHKEILCNFGISLLVENKKVSEQQRDEYLQEFAKIDKNPRFIMDILIDLFPNFGQRLGKKYLRVDDKILLKECRIGHINKFDLYFQLNINDLPYPNNVVRDIINELDYEGLKEIFTKINNDNNLSLLMGELSANDDEITSERLQLIIKFIYQEMVWFTKESSFMTFSPQYQALIYAEKLLLRLKDDNIRQPFIILKDLIQKANLQTFNSLAKTLMTIEDSYGRLGEEAKDDDNKIISLEEIIELEKSYIRRLNYLLVTEKNNLFKLDSLYKLLYLWKAFDSKNCDLYLKNLLETDENILQFIVRFSHLKISYRGDKGWEYNEAYSEFISKSDVLRAINGTSYQFKRQFLNEEEMLKLVSFRETPKESGIFSEVEAQQIVESWKLNDKDNRSQTELQDSILLDSN